jgi:CheY-like chemotaxis protein
MNRILIAEDNPVNRELLREILEADNYDVVEAGDGREALQKLEEVEPDLVLLDINMPVLDGFAAIRSFVNIRAFPSCPFWR